MISSSLSSHFTSAKLSYFRLLCNCKVKGENLALKLTSVLQWADVRFNELFLSTILHLLCLPLLPPPPSHTLFLLLLFLLLLFARRVVVEANEPEEEQRQTLKKFWPLWADSLQAAPLRETPLTVTFCGPLWVLWVTKLMMKASGNQIYLLQQTYCCKYKRSENGSLWNTCTDFKESWNISEVLSERNFSTWML